MGVPVSVGKTGGAVGSTGATLAVATGLAVGGTGLCVGGALVTSGVAGAHAANQLRTRANNRDLENVTVQHESKDAPTCVFRTMQKLYCYAWP